MKSGVCVLTVLCLLALTTYAIPLSDVDDTEEEIKRSVLLSRLLGATDRDVDVRSPLMDDRRLRELAGLTFTPQKRFRPAMQSRSGGMSLCLWKVCPAAPWLVTKRESNY